MQHKKQWASLIIGLLMSNGLLFAATPDAADIIKNGNGNGALACATCHQESGLGQPAAGFPRLAGQHPDYIRKQLADFVSGAREDPIMQPIAAALSDEETHALATYLSAQDMGEAASSEDQGDNHLGAEIALRGAWDRSVPACVQCHGPGGTGVGAHFPELAGQGARYIKNQLVAMRDGKRKNDPQELMRPIAEALTDDEMDAVAQWFAAQPPVLEQGE